MVAARRCSGLLALVLLGAGCVATAGGPNPVTCCSAGTDLSDWRRSQEVYVVSGVIRDSGPFDGPVSGAQVTATVGTITLDPVFSDMAGQYRVEFPRKRGGQRLVELVVHADGFELRRATAELSDRVTRRSIDLVLRREPPPALGAAR